MRKIYLLFLPVFLFVFSSFNVDVICEGDGFYTSITKVEYVSINKTLKISSKVNAEHIQQALGKKISDSDFDKVLSKYLSNRVRININNEPVSISYSSKNQDGNIVWIYYEVSGVANVSSISITNKLLMDKFEEQQNFVKFIINGQNKSVVCKKGAETGKVKF